MQIRYARTTDINQIFAIEKDSFAAPFTRGLFEAMLSNQPPFSTFVAEINNKIVGYLFYSSAADEREILTIAVVSSNRRTGIARKLIQKMMDEVKKTGAKSVFLEVRPTNHSAISLYTKFGFQKVGTRKKYYTDNDEDAIVMKVEMNR